MRRISDLTKRVRLRAYGGIGKGTPLKVLKPVKMKARKVK